MKKRRKDLVITIKLENLAFYVSVLFLVVSLGLCLWLNDQVGAASGYGLGFLAGCLIVSRLMAMEGEPNE